MSKTVGVIYTVPANMVKRIFGSKKERFRKISASRVARDVSPIIS